MRRGFTTFLLTVLGLYLGLHLVLGSSPVQKQVLAEIRAALAKFGLDLQMESIEFSAFSPKIYLNRVTLTAGPRSPFHLPEPLAIDKIKIQFQPLALIYRSIIIDELVLFHPRIIIPDAGQLYAMIEKQISSKKGVRVQSGSFSLVFRKVGFVDALMSVESQDPPFAFRTRSLSAFLQNNSSEQQSITLESNNIELERESLKLNLTKVDLDVDITKRSLRVNRAIVESEPLSVNIKGVSSLPFIKGKGPESVSASYDIQLSLPLLNQARDLGISPILTGRVISSGMIRNNGGALSGNGSLKYDGFTVKGVRVGQGSFAFNLGGEKLDLLNCLFHFGGGEVHSQKLVVSLRDSFPIVGELVFQKVLMEEILQSVKVSPSPVRMGLEGAIKVSGSLKEPFEIRGDTDAKFQQLIVLKNRRAPVSENNTVITVQEGGIKGSLTFTKQRMSFDAAVAGLGSEMQAQGWVGIADDGALIKARSEGTSLTELGHLAELRVAGKTALNAQIDVRDDGEVKVAGSFDIQDGEVASVVLGAVKGELFYQNDLLSFENLELPAIEPIRGSGFVDFKPEETHYKFTGDAKRVDMSQVFGVFQRQKLPFTQPREGEVSTRFTIEGGHDNKGVEVTASGQAKDFVWYDERWISSNFNMTYRASDTEISRLLLMKKSGAIEIKASFLDKSSQMSFASRGVRLEEMEYLHGSPVGGEVVGEVTFNGDGGNPFMHGNGEVKLVKTVFRTNPLPDTFLSLHSTDKQMELTGLIAGERLRGKFTRSDSSDELSLVFRDFDFAPFATLLMGKDIPSISDVSGSGNIAVTGKFSDFSSLKGGGTISALNLGFKGNPMHQKQAIQIKLDEGKVRVPRFTLEGVDSQLSLDLLYEPQKKVLASIDAKLDLQMLQPIIPGLDYGTGKVTVGARVSGPPDKYELLGNATIDDGSFRLTGLLDEFRSARGQFSISHERVSIDKFETTVNGGTFNVEGDVRINRFKTFSPNLTLHADQVALKLTPALLTRFSGDFFIRGTSVPYTLSGNCHLIEGKLTELATPKKDQTADAGKPVLNFDINCEAKDHFFVNTDMLEGELKGNFHVLGNTDHIGLMGGAEAIRGTVIFKDTRFAITSAMVKFESPTQIAPRFNVAGQAVVKENKLSRIQVSGEATTDRPQEYEVTLFVVGTPADYKLRLSSSPSLAENDIISLMVLGVTSKGQDGNYVDLGSALVGQIPLQSKFQNDFGIDIRIKSQTPTEAQQVSKTTQQIQSTSGSSGVTVPSVQIQKDITKSTRLSFSNTIEDTPTRELRLEQLLYENLSVDASVERSQPIPESQPIQSYGLDVRYRFHFE